MLQLRLFVVSMMIFCCSTVQAGQAPHAWPVEGEWGQVDEGTGAFQYVHIQRDGAGVFIHTYPNYPAIVVKFTSENITEERGLFTVRIPACNGVEKVFVAGAFQTAERGLLTGVLYLFRHGERGESELFNSLLVRTRKLQDGNHSLTASVSRILKESVEPCGS